MKTEPNHAAFEIVGGSFGLTKREWFAGLAMQGMTASFSVQDQAENLIAQWAVKQADVLIAELNNDQT